MSAFRLNDIAFSSRQRLAALTVLLALATSVAVHHLSVEDMGMHDMATHSAVVVCLGVMPAVGVVIAAAPGLRRPRLRPLRTRFAFPSQHALPAPPPRARSSPVETVVLRL